ncbi:MAG: AmmeMemoRadiSam system protein B [Candidatus Kapaibacterium sp.]|nr:MAG: AmmeMemoRadiSam system protein B [Candidatus Kapabacteria bacterium]
MAFLRIPSSFASEKIRPARFAGSSYPASERAVERLCGSVIQKPHRTLFSEQPVRQGATAIIAPHIDFRVGVDVYGPAYYALQDSSAEVFVIFATSHYAWGKQFIPTYQHFSTPLGVVKTDHSLLNALYERLPNLPQDDAAHHEEHSIEFETVFLQYLFGRRERAREFTILPILVTSFYPHIQQHRSPHEHREFQRFCEVLGEVLELSQKRVAFIASADMAHIGRKFDDPYDAEPMLPAMREEDTHLLRALEESDAESYYRRIAAVDDAYKICGLPPVYSMLKTAPKHCTRGQSLAYAQWNERETRSAVTYSSLAYYGADTEQTEA